MTFYIRKPIVGDFETRYTDKKYRFTANNKYTGKWIEAAFGRRVPSTWVNWNRWGESEHLFWKKKIARS